MRVLVAGRLSRKVSDRDQTGFDSQEREAVRWSESEGHTVAAVVADFKSGKTHLWERRNLRPWVTDPDKIAQYDAIVALKVDRLTRANDEGVDAMKAWARQHGKQILIAGSGVRFPSEGTDGALWDLMIRQAHQEWLSISERYTRMHNHLRTTERPDGQVGYFVGRPPFGYLITCSAACGDAACGHHKILEPNPELVPYLLGMADRYLNGDTLTSICEWLDSAGVKPTGHKASKHKVWQQTIVRTVLSNPVLMGRRNNGNGEILKVTPVLDMPTWNRLQVKLAASAAKPRRGKISRDTALLTGIIYCARCGGVMHYHRTANTRDDGSKQYNYYYRCTGTTRDVSRCRNMFPLASADAYLGSFMTDVIGPMELVSRNVVPAQSHDDDLADIDAAIAALDQDSGDYDERHAVLRAERRRVKNLPKPDVTAGEKRTGVSMAEHWGALDTDAQRRQWLLSGQVKVLAYMPPLRGELPGNLPEPTAFPAGERPFTFTVEVKAGEWTARPWVS